VKSAAIITTILVLCGVLGGPALGFELKLPGAAALTHETEPVASDVNIATGPWAGGVLSHVTVSGQLTRQSWRLGSAGLSTLQILTPLTEQLADAGYTPLFRCDQDQCGGFDFRFAQQGLPEPYMHVDLGDFRYFAAQKMTDEGGRYRHPDGQPLTLCGLCRTDPRGTGQRR
jgi:OOP family OmpA-OmpF porin